MSSQNINTEVTLVCITYNHEAVLEQALDSFIRQKTNFKFQIFVGDDCSKDNTPNIIKEYAKKYPDLIVPFIREKNMGAQRNLMDMCSQAQTKYIAFCEGDDYLIDDYKLQKQYDFMEANQDFSACFHNTLIQADKDWYFGDYYKPNELGQRLIPGSIPRYNNDLREMRMDYYIRFGPAHTSSMFFRWDYSVEIPEWYYTLVGGDHPMMMLQVGDGKLGFLPDVMSVYRRSEVGVTMCNNATEHFLKTRESWVDFLLNIKEHFAERYGDFCQEAIDYRIVLEETNFINSVMKSGEIERISSNIEKYPKAFEMAMNKLLQQRIELWNINKALSPQLVKAIVKHQKLLPKIKKSVRKVLSTANKKAAIKNKYGCLKVVIKYWAYALVPKQKNLWVFTSFKQMGYLDNSKYLFEYVSDNHKEIQAVWLDKNKELVEELREKGYQAYIMNSKEGRKMLRRAKLAFSDHFRMSDYPAKFGFNARTELVQLWHGVGLKSMDNFKLTTVKGVQNSDDIIPQKGDSFFTRMKKAAKRIVVEPFREMCENYYMLVCPGNERKETLAKTYRTKQENCFLSGYPRNVELYKQEIDLKTANPKILYAPTYRWNAQKETEMVDGLIAALPSMEKLMEENNGSFVIRLHPHTWRDYRGKIETAIQNMNHIYLDFEKDIYKELGTYTMIISDYSSIAYDFLLLNRPIIFYCYDYEYFIQKECTLSYDYNEYSPGKKTFSWDETMEAIQLYINHPEEDNEWRLKVANFFYDLSVNDINNSKRIVQELERRLNI